MDNSINTLLNDLSARLGCDVPVEDETQRQLSEAFSETTGRVATVADEIRQLASEGDALAFTAKLFTFLEDARTKALATNRLRDEIAERESRLAEAHEELDYLSAGREALADKVKAAMLALEYAQRDYATNELRLGVVERSIETARLERSELRRKLDALKKSKED